MFMCRNSKYATSYYGGTLVSCSIEKPLKVSAFGLRFQLHKCYDVTDTYWLTDCSFSATSYLPGGGCSLED